MKAENVNFAEAQVREIYQKVISILWNTFSFYKLYGKTPSRRVPEGTLHDLDRWIVSKTHRLVRDVTDAMDHYDTITTCRAIGEFIDELSTWYLRRSRERLRTDANAMSVFGWVLETLVRVMAPVTPFLSELIYQNLDDVDDSVHLTTWPTFDEKYIDDGLEEKMEVARKMVEALHSLRKQESIAVKQPLHAWGYKATTDLFSGQNGIPVIVSEEINTLTEVSGNDLTEFAKRSSVRSASFESKNVGTVTVYLDTEITKELEGKRKERELLRAIQMVRKEHGYRVDQPVTAVLPKEYDSISDDAMKRILKESLVQSFTWGEALLLSTG